MPDTETVANWLDPFLKAAEISQEALGEKLGLSRATVNRLANDHSKLKRDRAEQMASHLQVTVEQLMLNRPPASGRADLRYEPFPENDPSWHPEPESYGAAYSRENYSPTIPGAIPELDAKAGAGEGAVGEMMVLPMRNGQTYSGHKVTGEWYIPMAYLRDAVTNAKQTVVLQVEGDSMLPNYYPGDRVLIDLQQTEMRVDGVYLITDGESPPQIKRLQRVPFTSPAMVEIRSDNPSYRVIEIELSRVIIMGKIAAHVARK